jgi:hypothetical protein
MKLMRQFFTLESVITENRGPQSNESGELSSLRKYVMALKGWGSFLIRLFLFERK